MTSFDPGLADPR